MAREEEIKCYMEKLGISYEEAEQLWEDDKEDYIGDEGEEMQAKAKKNIRNQGQSTKKRKKATREKKVDNEKLEILKLCQGILEENGIIATIEKEVAIHFEIEDTQFTLQLTRHRPLKK